MVVKIKELNIKKDELEKVKFGGSWTVADTTKLDGKIKVELSEGIALGSGEIKVTDIPEKLQNKLYDVLSEIEDELNGVEKEPSTNDDFLNTLSEEKKNLKSLEELEKELKGKIKYHSTDDNEFRKLEDILESVSKLFGSAVFVGNKEYKNALKSKGFDML